MTLYSLTYMSVCGIICLHRKKIIFYSSLNKIAANSYWVPAKWCQHTKSYSSYTIPVRTHFSCEKWATHFSREETKA